MRVRFSVNRVDFCIDTDPRIDRECIKSIHPYDETEYHWARESLARNQWIVFRQGKRVAVLDGPLTKEQVAERLLRFDREANLTRTGGIW